MRLYSNICVTLPYVRIVSDPGPMSRNAKRSVSTASEGGARRRDASIVPNGPNSENGGIWRSGHWLQDGPEHKGRSDGRALSV